METPSGGDQVADEDKGLARRSDVAGAPVPVGQIRGDDQLAAAADLHPLHALVPAGDDATGTELELQRVAAIPAGVEFLPRRVGDPDVVDLDRVSCLRGPTVAFPDVGDLQLGRRLAAGEVDVGLADAHNRLSRLLA